MGFILFAAAAALVDLGVLFLIFLYFRKRFRDEISLGEVLEKARREIGSLVAELNRTTDRNVTLLEDRIAAAKEAAESAARSFEAVKREKDARERERAAYDRMGRVRPLVQAGEPARDAKPAAGAEASRQRTPGPVGGSVAAETKAGDPARDAEAVRREEASGQLPLITASSEPVRTGKPPAEAALGLWERGFSAEIIASRVGMSVAEVELAIAMEEQRRLTSR